MSIPAKFFQIKNEYYRFDNFNSCNFHKSRINRISLWLGTMSNDMMKKSCLLLFGLSSLWMYRMELFNLMVKYEVETEIPIVEIKDEYWVGEIEKIINSTSYVGVVEFNDRILQLISSKLNFGKNQVIKDPNKLRESTAHCVGYASLNSALLNYYCKNTSYEISHVRGKVLFLGYDLTNLSKSNFWRNHDFVRIKHKSLNKEYFSDASIYEYLRISRIGLKYGM